MDKTAEQQAAKTFEEKCTAVDMCPKCGGELDTGWECNLCGYDAMPIAQRIEERKNGS